MLAKQVHHSADASDVHEAGLIHDKLPGHFATRIKHPGVKECPAYQKCVVWTIMNYWLKWGGKMCCDFFVWHA